MRFATATAAAVTALAALAGAPVRARAQASIPAHEFAARRDSLAARVGDGVVVAFGGRTPVTDFGPFYQLPAFHYLTNFDEADAAVVLVVRGGKAAGTLFLTPIEPRRAFYYGRRPDSAEVARATGLAAAGLPFWTLADFADADFARADSLTRGQAFMTGLAARHPGLVVKDAHPLLDQLRARKSPGELALIRRAAEASVAGHRAAMRTAAPGLHEYDLQAVAEAAFLRHGGERPSYGSIVGSGIRGTQLHYMKDRGPLNAGDLVVIDAGTQVDGYAADVTRTLPVTGKFTPEQRRLYQLVRDAQAAAERNSRAGLSARAAADSSVEVRARGLAALGLIESADAQFDPPWRADCTRAPQQCRQVTLWTIHGISHGLGLAVHDPAQFYYGDRTFQVGDAFTIEPGIYVSTAALDLLPDTPRNRAFIAKVRPVVERYENTGVRIEDDYVITPQGTEWISRAPRELAEVEAAMKSPARTATPGKTGKGGASHAR